MEQFLPILAMIVLVFLFAALSFVASKLLGPKRPTSAKEAPYECGIVPEVEPAERFPVKFYLVAMAFIVLDVEIIFLYPFTTVLRALGAYGARSRWACSCSCCSCRSPTCCPPARSTGVPVKQVVDPRRGHPCCARPACPGATASTPAARRTPTSRGGRVAMGLEPIPHNFLTGRLEDLVKWARRNSVWPATFGLACCAIEMMAAGAAHYDLARFGMEVFRASPRQADLMIVAGRVSQKMAPVLRQVYDQMVEPKWVISMGVCASTGGMFNNYAIVQGVDQIVPVDVYVPGLPARARDADARHPHPARPDPHGEIMKRRSDGSAARRSRSTRSTARRRRPARHPSRSA